MHDLHPPPVLKRHQEDPIPRYEDRIEGFEVYHRHKDEPLPLGSLYPNGTSFEWIGRHPRDKSRDGLAPGTLAPVPYDEYDGRSLIKRREMLHPDRPVYSPSFVKGPGGVYRQVAPPLQSAASATPRRSAPPRAYTHTAYAADPAIQYIHGHVALPPSVTPLRSLPARAYPQPYVSEPALQYVPGHMHPPCVHCCAAGVQRYPPVSYGYAASPAAYPVSPYGPYPPNMPHACPHCANHYTEESPASYPVRKPPRVIEDKKPAPRKRSKPPAART